MNQIIAYTFIALLFAVCILSLMLDSVRKENNYLREQNHNLQRKLAEYHQALEAVSPPIINETV